MYVNIWVIYSNYLILWFRLLREDVVYVRENGIDIVYRFLFD